jgi:hypothetical protein
MRKVVLAFLLIASFIVPSSVNAATAKAGASCTKLKTTKVVGTKKFTCIKSGKKLVWDKGITIPKPIVRKSQEIDFPEINARYLIEKRIALTPGVTTGGLPVAITGSGACLYDGATSEIVLNSLGSCSLTASQPGNANFLAATPITRIFEVKKVSQVIKAPEVTDQDLLKANSYQFEFPQAGSSAPFVIASKTADICAVDSYKVSFYKVGSCILVFTKAGDLYYEASNEATATFRLFLSAQPGEKGNPAPLGTEITKGDIAVTLDAVSEGVSSAVCAADAANKGCIDKNGTGVFESSAEADRYIEVSLSILNNGKKTWIADNLTVQVSDSRSYQKSIVHTIDSLDGLELEPGDGISGSYFVLVPADVDSRTITIIYSDGTEAGTFHFKV